MAVSNSAVPSADFRMQILCGANLIICTCNLRNVSNKLIYVFILQFAAEGVDTCLHLKFLNIFLGCTKCTLYVVCETFLSVLKCGA